MSDYQVRFGSVCSGLEAASVAWSVLGWKAAWFAEIELYPSKVLAHHYPDVPNLGNMLLIPALLRNGTIEAPDVLCGGTPCQSFSIAGLRNSLGDKRGNLSLTFCEIANEIDIQRAAAGLFPCVVKWENVPGVLTTEDNAFGCFLAGLAGATCTLVPEPCPAAGKSGKFWKWKKSTGRHTLSWPKSGCVIGPQRTVAWRVLDAQYFGLAQRRNRVFVVASARAGFDPVAVLLEFDGVRRDFAPSRGAGQNIAGSVTASLGKRGGQPDCGSTPGYLQPVEVTGTLTATYGEQSGRDLAEMPGGLQVVQAFGGNDTRGPIEVSTALRAHNGPHLDFESETFLVQPALSVALRGREGGGTAELGDYLAACLRASTGGGDKPHVLAPIAFNSRETPVSSTEVFGALGTSSPQAQAVSYAIQAGALRENPASGPDGVGVQSDIAYTLEARPEVQAVCVTGDITHALKAEGFDASEDGTGRGQPIINVAGAMCAHAYSGGMGGRVDLATQGYFQPVGMAVRRLMPVECEKLQGFPPGYTHIPIGKKMAADGPRYKAIGNSWAIPCITWIGRRIDNQLRGKA